MSEICSGMDPPTVSSPAFRSVHLSQGIHQDTNIRFGLRLEKLIYQRRGARGKFDSMWAPWLNVPGLAPVDLVYDRLF